jgi:hypothetical protein
MDVPALGARVTKWTAAAVLVLANMGIAAGTDITANTQN